MDSRALYCIECLYLWNYFLVFQVEETLNILADGVLLDQVPVKRKKMEQLITELVHQRDVTRELIANKISSNRSFDWLCQMRYVSRDIDNVTLFLKISRDLKKTRIRWINLGTCILQTYTLRFIPQELLKITMTRFFARYHTTWPLPCICLLYTSPSPRD